MTKLSEYVKVAETAQILGVSQGTVRAWADSGKIPMHKNPANGYRMFRPSDLERFLAKVATKATGKHASFREHKPLDQFDWSFNPSIKKKQVFDLATCRFIREAATFW